MSSDDYHSVSTCVQRRVFVIRRLSLCVNVCAEERDKMQLVLLSACINMENFSHKTENRERSVSEIAGEQLS